MKKNPTDSEDRPRPEARVSPSGRAPARPTSPLGEAGPSDAWREALRLFDADLVRRGAAERTRRAYGFDCAQFALWCTAQSLDPDAVTTRALRRYAAALGERDVVAATVARKLAALRALYRTL